MKKILLLPLEFGQYFNALSNIDAGALIKAIFNHQKCHSEQSEEPQTDSKQNLEKPNFNSRLANAVWHLLQPTLENHLQKHSRRKNASVQNGKKGGRPKKPKNLEEPKLTKEQILLRIQAIQKELDKRALNENQITSQVLP